MTKSFISYANSFQAIAKLRLESIKELMNNLGNPQDSLKFIHIAGTNGKGSVCCYLQSILTDAGFVTGRYTSPNMLRVNERISVDNVEISDCDLERIMSVVEEKALKVKEKTGDMPTQFEIWTAAAFCYFKEKECDYVVLETGLGGTQDATNVIKNPVMSVITKIAIDHTEYLGNSLTEITSAKAGIIKNSKYGGCTVCAKQDEEALKVIKEACKNANNKFIAAKDVSLHNAEKGIEEFDYDGIFGIRLSMLGEHQAENAALAIECARYLNVREEFIKSGLYKAKNIGRFEIINNEPLILFDGAHNKNGMNSLCNSLRRHFGDRQMCFIMGCMRDKDIEGGLEELKSAGFMEKSIFYTVTVKDNPRAATADELKEILKNNGFGAVSTNSIKEAVELSKRENKMIVICGSLYLYKDYFEECVGIDKEDSK